MKTRMVMSVKTSHLLVSTHAQKELQTLFPSIRTRSLQRASTDWHSSNILRQQPCSEQSLVTEGLPFLIFVPLLQPKGVFRTPGSHGIRNKARVLNRCDRHRPGCHSALGSQDIQSLTSISAVWRHWSKSEFSGHFLSIHDVYLQCSEFNFNSLLLSVSTSFLLRLRC